MNSSVPTAGENADEPLDPVRVWLRVVRLQQRVSASVAGQLRGIGLSIPQFDVISTLTEREGITQQELAERLYVTKGNVSGLIDRMVDAGLVERRPTAGDRRSHALHLTHRGRKLAEQGIALQRSYVAATLGRLSPDDVAELDRIIRLWREEARSWNEEAH
jgi:MarR family transcriptional regulator, organic hydroperoxide resistance regulator